MFDLNINNQACIWFLASIYMSLKQFFPACQFYQKWMDLVEEVDSKCDAIWRLMYMYYEERDWQQLSKMIAIYDEWNIKDDIEDTVNWYSNKLR